MRQKFGVVLVFCLLLILSGCNGRQTNAPVIDGWQQSTASDSVHIVRQGETLYSIAWQYGYDYRDLVKLNNIPESYSIQVGQELVVFHQQSDRQHALKQLDKKPITNKRQQNQRVNRAKSLSNNIKVRQKVLTNGEQTWRWPVNGLIIKKFNLNSQSISSNGFSKGIDIAGKDGSPIVAARAGKVVYSGHGLNGYGNLIIIKHDTEFLSAYAHNKRNLVKEGTQVRAGQKIALLGKTGTTREMLHFEIRRSGKPSNPLKFLPTVG